MKLSDSFFDNDPTNVAKGLLGKVLRRYISGIWLSAQIIETEAYYLEDKASHASLGYTKKRHALFAPPGTIYMYYSRGGDSLNVSCRGAGNAVLIKSAFPYLDPKQDEQLNELVIKKMQELNPSKDGPDRPRPKEKLCSGQVLLCKSLNLKVKELDNKNFNSDFFIKDVGYIPNKIITTKRLGIRVGRDEHLPYRFIDFKYAKYCSKRPPANSYLVCCDGTHR